MNAAILQEDTYALDVYTRRGLVLVRGEDATVWDEQGRQYIDCVGGHGSANVGHGNKAVAEAVASQAARFIACSNVYYNNVRGRYLELLLSVVPEPIRHAFLCNSGAEAVEAAFKFARYATGRTEIISTFRAFHGRTLGALSLTHNPTYRNGFGPLVPGVTFVPYNDPQAMTAAVTEATAAVILEVVQGEGGVHVAKPEFLDSAARVCREHGALLIIDEVQTGFGRTGRLFAAEHFDLRPDIICLAKSIAAGLPMGATLCSDRISIPSGAHGTTFGGNPLCCAAAHATLQYILSEGLATVAEAKGEYLRGVLSAIQSSRIREIRGLGLMVGIDLREKVKPFIEELQHAGVLALPAGPTVLRLLPPLTITYPQLDMVAEAISRALSG
jgi:predicted acetylornithine/succinylornithine family transaminase